MSILAWIVLGLIAGFIASQIVNRHGGNLLLDIILGVVGAVVGGFIFNYFGHSAPTGINFYSIPFSGQAPDPAVADKFLDTITAPGNEPAYIHCASGNRAAAMWMIKRISLDHWDTDRAAAEAASLGLTNQALKQFAIDYAQSHKQ